MAKASDNVFPRVIHGLNTADQAAPGDSSWRVYAKANGIFARSSNSVVGPFGTSGAGTTVATDTIWDAKGDLVAATGADAATKVTVGANNLALIADSAVSNGVKWAHPVLTSSTGDCTADTTLTADTIADVTGASISLAAGTWLLIGHIIFSATTATFDYTLGAITDSSNVVQHEMRGLCANNGPVGMALSVVVSPGSTTTYKLRGQSGRSGNKTLRYSSGTQIGSRLIALRVA